MDDSFLSFLLGCGLGGCEKKMRLCLCCTGEWRLFFDRGRLREGVIPRSGSSALFADSFAGVTAVAVLILLPNGKIECSDSLT